MSLSIVILAAGAGKRMHSDTPKVLHRLAGKPLLEHIADTALKISPQTIIVYGHQGDAVRHALSHLNVTWIEQTEQRGTGHALQQALPHVPADHRILILNGDVPLISVDTLKHFIQQTPIDALGMITAVFPNPQGLGRIIRQHNRVIDIIEERDASKEQLANHEINAGIYLIAANHLHQWLPKLQNQNAQKEYYLTEVIRFAVQDHIAIHDIQPQAVEEVHGVNDRIQLAFLERYYQKKRAEEIMRQGTTLYDPARFDLRGDLIIGRDVTIDINVIIEGKVIIGNHCTIGANVILRNVILRDHVDIKPNTIIDGAEIADHCSVGPFARIRPGTVLATHVHIGNFAEIKNSFIGEASKIHHVSYTGDTEIGKHVNIGAGTITCNYDGVNKHKTVIGDYAFIGSNTSLIAPVQIGEGATIGAGSTIHQFAPAHQLTLARARQLTIEDWQRKK